MCGIAGIIDTTAPVTEPQIAQMTHALTHRGPNDEGIWISPDREIGLGQRRLSIVDLSEKGHQPMFYQDLVLVFNGEIYNYQELKKELISYGHKFCSETDSEVLLVGFSEWGPEIVQRLRGMFAFAIWDQKSKKLFAARDHLGKKPFKYWCDGAQFIFASELKAILTQPQVPRKIDPAAISHFLTFQSCPGSLTGFQDIQKLPPAHTLTFDLRTQQVQIERYWRLDLSQKKELEEKEWQQRILDKLEESIKLRMVADVSLGVHLSGGVDSSIIVALMAQNSTQKTKTFSIGFDDRELSELPYAQAVADYFETDHTEFVVQPEAFDILEKVVYFHEEPFADPASLATWYLAELTRQHVTVALNGDGGDENFGGYPWHSIEKFAQRWDKYPTPMHHITNFGAEILSKISKSTFTDRAHIFTDTTLQSPAARYCAYTAFFRDDQKPQVLTLAFQERIKNDLASTDLIERFYEQAQNAHLDSVDTALWIDINTFLPDTLLPKVDIMTMAHSLEARSPFLDREFMEMTAQIPSDLKIKGGNERKWVLKQALEQILPAEFMDRKKQGFNLPLDEWFRETLHEPARAKLLSPNPVFHQIIQEEFLENLLHEHKEGRDWGKQIWLLCCLSEWITIYKPEL